MAKRISMYSWNTFGESILKAKIKTNVCRNIDRELFIKLLVIQFTLDKVYKFILDKEKRRKKQSEMVA